ncbi:MAG TPA: hypothetical protein VFF06_32120 [Polyangia bacterium]|nr:hypothetical protein [Polyangia bacterium]
MGQAPSDDLKTVADVEREVDELRLRTQALLEELERRIRDGVDRARGAVDRVKHAVDVPARLRELPAAIRKRPALAGGIGLGTVAVVGFGVWLAVHRRRQAARPMARLRRRALAYRALLAEPHRALEPRPRIWRKLLGAVLIAAATSLARNLVGTAYHEVAERRPRQLPEPLGV